MKIGIVETHYHAEFVHTLVQLFKKENITVYTTRDVYNNIEEESKDVHYIFKHSKQKTKDFISSIPTANFDLLFVNTIQPSMVDLPNWKNFKPKCKSILTLHNLNAWYNKKFIPRFVIAQSFDSYIASRYTKKILKNFNYLNVVYGPMFNMACEYFITEHQIIYIPFAFAQEQKQIKTNDTIDFVVPGTVSNKRRNYKPVLEAFDNLTKKYDNIQLVLLGKNKANIKTTNPKIKTFDETVPINVYNSYLQNANFIIVPSRFFTYSVNTADEYYGFSKSPNIHEAVKWRKPLILPEHIPLDSRLTNSTVKYESAQDLETKIKDLLDNKSKVKSIEKEVLSNTKYFTLNNLREMVYKELEI